MRDKKITNKERFQHVFETITKIDDFCEGHSKKSFLDDDVLQNAILFQFAIIGEAIVHIDQELLSKYPYAWHHVRSFRNFIVHEYHAIENWIIWETVKNDLPELKLVIDKILDDEF